MTNVTVESAVSIVPPESWLGVLAPFYVEQCKTTTMPPS